MKLDLQVQGNAKTFRGKKKKQEGQDGPGSLTGFFDIALAKFFCRFQR